MRAAIEVVVRDYARQTTVLFDACRQLVEYHGADDELSSFDGAIAWPRQLLDAVVTTASGGNDTASVAACPSTKLECSEEIAAMLTPLLQILVEWEPPFTFDARQTLEPDEASALVACFGRFWGETGRLLCAPIWAAYPRLAPQGWPTR